MFSQSTARLFMLVFACAGLLVGCEDSSPGNPAGKDSGQDTRPGDQHAAVEPDTTLAANADASRGSDSAPDAEPAKKDVAIEDLYLAKLDTASDVVEPKDVGADAADGKDAPPSVDSRTDSAPVPDGGALEVSAVMDGARLADAPASADTKPGVDSSLSSYCQSILLDNTFMPPTYPVLYPEPANAAETFATRSAALLSAYSLADADYTFKTVPVSWTATIEQGMGPCTLLLGGPLTKETSLATAQSFLSRWSDLFQYRDTGKESVPTSCDSKFCMVRLAQDYCGLSVFSKDQNYHGDVYVDIYAKDGCLWRAISHFVPMVPIPRNVLLSEAKLKQAIVGLTLTYACPEGQRSVQVSENDTFIMPDAPKVVVRKSPTIGNTLEYRLAVPVVVEIGGSEGLPWTVYVDGLDGTVLENVAGIICG
jgi:hypothetical protein